MIFRACLAALLALFLGFVAPAQAHEVRPAYLEIREEAPGVLDIRFRQPVLSLEGSLMSGLNLSPVFPAACTHSETTALSRSEDYFTQRYQVVCPQGLSPITVSIDGLSRSLTDVYATYTRPGQSAFSYILNASEAQFSLDEAGKPPVLGYFMVGVDHLLGGLDHVLFVIGLVLLLPNLFRVVTVATMFTLAHSLTLGLSVLDIVQAPSAPVEAGIALSVLYLALEVTRSKPLTGSIARRRPELIACGFGLLHGFGFAGALSETGMPEGQIAPALLLFNVGVEAGQIVVVAIIGLSLLAVGACGARWRTSYEHVLASGLTIGAGYFFAGGFMTLIA